MIQYAVQYGEKKYIPELKKLWGACFADEDAYIDAFFEAMYADGDLLLAQKKGMLMGASFFLPGRIYLNGKWQDIRYVYALAVYRQYRGQKIAHTLLNEACRIYRVPLLTEPADQGLAEQFYAPYGFSGCFYLQYDKLSMEQAQLLHRQGHWIDKAYLSPIEADAYCQLREQHFQGQGYVSWPQNHIAFAIQEHRANGGNALVITGRERKELLLYTAEGTQLTITETTLPLEDVAALFSTGRIPYETKNHPYRWLVMKSSLAHAGQTTVSAMELQPKQSNHFRQLLGMAYGVDLAQGYMNLTLD